MPGSQPGDRGSNPLGGTYGTDDNARDTPVILQKTIYHAFSNFQSNLHTQISCESRQIEVHAGVLKMNRITYKLWFLSTSVILSFLLHPDVFCETGEANRWNIQGYALKNIAPQKKSKSNSVIIMGAFASTDEPTTEPIPLTYEFSTFSKFYVGVVIVNPSDKDKNITVTFELSGIRNGKENAEFTIPGKSTFLAYIDDTLGRMGFYTYKIGIKNLNSATITLMLTE